MTPVTLTLNPELLLCSLISVQLMLKGRDLNSKGDCFSKELAFWQFKKALKSLTESRLSLWVFGFLCVAL